MGIRLPVSEREQMGVQNTPRQAQTLARQMPQLETDYIDRADNFLKEMEKRRKEAQDKAMDFLKRKAQNQIDGARQEAEFKVLSARGENAFKATDSATVGFQDKIVGITSELPDQVKGEVELYSGKALNQYSRSATGHTLRESNKVQDETYKTRNNFLTEQAALNSYDESSFIQSLSDIDENTEAYERNVRGGAQGLPSREVSLDIAAKKLSARSTAITKTVEVLASQGDLDKAEYYATTYRDTLTPTDLIRINNILDKGREDNVEDQALVIMTKAIEGSAYNPIVANQLVQELAGGNGKLYAKAKTYTDAQITDFEQNTKRVNAERLASALDAVRTGKRVSVKDVDVADRETLRQYLEKRSKGELNIRNPRTYNEMYDLMVNQPDVFRDPNLTNINAKALGLAGDDIKYFQTKQADMQNPETEKFQVGTVNDIVNRVIDIKGVRKKPKEMEALRFKATQVLEDVKASLGPRATRDDIRKKFETAYMDSLGTEESAPYQNSIFSPSGVSERLKRWTSGENPKVIVPLENKAREKYNRDSDVLRRNYRPEDVDRMRAYLFENNGGVQPDEAAIIRGLEAEKSILLRRSRLQK